MRRWLAHAPSLAFSSNPQGDRREQKQSEPERCSEEAREREIRDKAENHKPLCVSTGHRHSNPSLPSQDSNDLRVHPPWMDLCIFYRGGWEGHAPPFQTPPFCLKSRIIKTKMVPLAANVFVRLL